MRILTFLCLALFGSLATPFAIAQKTAAPAPESLTAEIRQGVKVMDTWYRPAKGYWENAAGNSNWWWQSANALTALIRFDKVTGSKEHLPYIKTAFEKNQRGNFLNEFYDDEGWWALAWVEAYELTNNPRYLRMAEIIFADMTKGWSEDFGGGIWWKKDHLTKHAIENNLFILLGLRLHAHRPNAKVAGKTYRQWAEATWAWYEQTGFIEADFRVADALKPDGSMHRVYFTYNQGVTLACAVEFYQLTQDEKFLRLAEKLADAALEKMTDEKTGVLREWLEPNSTQDLAQFKGIFMRHLYTLYTVTRKPAYGQFILKNAAAIRKNKDPQTGRYGVSWFLPYKETAYDFQAHSSALDCLAAAAGVEKLSATQP